MTSPILSFVPEQSGYGVEHPNQVVSIELDGGAPRLRADTLGANHHVDVSWLLNEVDYTSLLKFFRQDTERGSLPFRLNLVTELFQLARHRATIVPGSLRTTVAAGLTYSVSARLRVEQLDLVTGTATFIDPDEIILAIPDSTSLFQPGDFLQLVGAELDNGVDPAIDLDGIYTVDSITDSTRLVLLNPQFTNADWTLLASYGVAPSINNVSWIRSPS